MEVKEFFEKITGTISYIVYDPASKDALIIDPVLDFNSTEGTYSTTSFNEQMDYIKSNNLKPSLVLETHAHADHISSSQFFKKEFPNILVAIGKDITEVQSVFKSIFKLSHLATDGSQFDKLIKDQEEFFAGSIKIKAIHTPGHTPSCLSYLIEDKIFVGDSIFVPETGTGRCDFPKGDAKTLFHSVKQKLYTLNEDTKVYVAHNYPEKGEPLHFQTTIKDLKENNIHIKEDTKLEDFLKFRKDRDKQLNSPKLLFQSIQININAGKFETDENGNAFLKMPMFKG
ncbi:MAG: MBL fold metallo-hydrolase [Bdellovibrionaceae bacterium]|nr:MBL fold metallo-hydrolase [Pseudobdellovibrionaceae bacterium]